MSTEDRIKMEDKKAKRKYIICVTVTTILAGFLGFFSSMYKDDIVQFFSSVGNRQNLILYMLIPVSWGMNIIAGIVCVVWLRQSKKLYLAWDGEDEEHSLKMEWGADASILLSNIVSVLNLFLFAVQFHLLKEQIEQKEGMPEFLTVLLGLILGVTVLILIQQRALNLKKTMNPEKRGSVFDFDLEKKWVASSDEAQRAIRYQAGYQAYKAMQVVCIGSVLVGIMIDVLFENGLLLMFFGTILWLTGIVIFHVTEQKIAKEGNI